MIDRVLGLASALSLVFGAATAPAGLASEVEFTFKDPEIVESSGLVADSDGLFVTMNDSGDRGRIFVVDRSGATVGTTSWAAEPRDVESLAPAGPGEVWVGDTGDNSRKREGIMVLRVPYGTGDREVTPAAYRLVYPDGAHDAETLMTNPDTGQLFVVSKDIFGGTLYAAPRRLSADQPNRLRAVADGFPYATDGSFFPDGKHYVVRSYTGADVYEYPGHEQVGSFLLPAQQQGEGISVGPDGKLYLSSEGQFSDVLRMRVPADVAARMNPTETTAPNESVGPATGSDPDSGSEDEGELPWPWLVGGGLVFVVGAGWLLTRRGQAS